MRRHTRYLIIIFSLMALMAFGAQVIRGIVTGSASQCSVSGTCR